MYNFPASPSNSAQPPKPKSRNLWLIVGGLGLVTAVCLCVIALVAIFVVVKPFSTRPTPTSTATPRPTRTPIPTSLPSPTPLPAPIRIALLAPLSGPVSTFGDSVRDGAQMAVDEWNSRGGILGKPVELSIQDSQCSADPAANAASKVIEQDGVHYIIGEVCSSASVPVSEIANANGVVQISPASTSLKVTTNADGTVKPYSFTIAYSDEYQAKVMARFAVEQLNARSAFLLYDPQTSYIKDMSDYFEQYFTGSGGVIVGKETYSAADTDFSSIFDKVTAAQPDVIYLPDFHSIVNLVTQQAKEKGLSTTFLGSDSWDSTGLDLTAAEGGYFNTQYYLTEDHPAAQNFAASYREVYMDDRGNPKEPDALAALTYDAVNMLLVAIEKAGVDDPALVKDVLAGIQYEAVTGQISFDSQHTPLKSVIILQIRGGQIVYSDTVTP
jgi:branched-chain amino acid transport system substrate-binding protein